MKTVILTRTELAKWKRNGGLNCPNCGSINVETTAKTTTIVGIIRDRLCYHCGARWREVYTLSGIPNNEIHVPADAAGA